MKRDLVQLRNPKTGLYVKIDRTAGVILSHKKSPGPYKGIRIHGGKKDGRKRTLESKISPGK